MAPASLVAEYAPLVRRSANELMARVAPSVRVEDLVQAGMIGLLEALERFDDSQGARFETYANVRVRGAMVDELRHMDPMPRRIRKRLRDIEKLTARLQQERGREPTDRELAVALNVPLDAYQHMRQDGAAFDVIYLEDLGGEESEHFACDTNLLELLQENRRCAALNAAIGRLPEREKSILDLYYNEDLTHDEIGAMLGITGSRVCQLHAKAIQSLRAEYASQDAA